MPVRSWQDKLSIPTYPLGADDPNPPFHRQGGSWAIYPYPMRDDVLEGPAEAKDWTAVHVENEYLHCIVLPELGGHMYSLYDKLMKREVFYRNNVVKYGLVSMRGAWVSGGIEFNFPTGHTYTTVDPVSWEMGQDEEDGTAWLAVGNICRLSHMEWWVRLSLSDGERRLHEEVFLHNPTQYKQRYWFWNNSAVPATDDLHLVYPARKARVAGGVVDYPVMADGTDISWYKNHDHADDIFTMGVTEGFFGCHYVESDYGMVNISDPREVSGRKFFTWGTADDGMIWEGLLTDEDGQYVEIQSGRFETQSVWEFLQPNETVSWEEWWMPEHGMGGWVHATEDAVLNFEVRGRQVKASVLVAYRVEDGVLTLSAGGREIASEEVFARPVRPVTFEATLPAWCAEDAELTLTLVGEDEDYELLRYVHPPMRTRKPKVAETGEAAVVPGKAEGECVAEELCVRALESLRQLADPEARRLCENALALDEGFCRAHVILGLLDYQAGHYAAAREHLERAMGRDRNDGEAWYYLGLARWNTGDLEAALEALGEARRLQPGSLAAQAAIWDVEYELNPAPAPASGDGEEELLPLFIEMGAYGLAGITRDLADLGPADALARFKQWTRGDAQMWIEATLANGPQVAAAVLEMAVRECPAAAAYPMTHYLLGHWYEALGRPEDAEAARKRGRECAPDFCFPNRAEELAALEEAVAAEPEDWKARYYLGNILAALGRHAEAMAHWRAAEALDGGYAVLQRNLGFGALTWESDPTEAVRRYQLALERNPLDYHYYENLADVLAKHWDALATGDEVAPWTAMQPVTATSAQLALLRSAPAEVQSKWQIAARIAELLAQMNQYDEALGLLREHRYFPWEGARGMRGAYADCLLGRGQAAADQGDHAAALADFEAATEYPRNLCVGKVARPQDARLWWLAAREAGAVGDAERRERYLAEAAEEPHGGLCEADWWKLLALRELGRGEEAGALEASLREWAEGLVKSERTKAQGEEMLGRLNG